MSIDLSQFHQVFLEESFEGLDIMESALMELDPADIDSETINAIFRAAHSIKGGSATFGFSKIAEFTHILETILDQVRAGTRSIKEGEVDLYLQSVDCMRDMLYIIQAGDNKTTEKSDALSAQFNALLNVDVNPVVEHLPEPEVSILKRWTVGFSPCPHILKTGNDPVRILGALRDLGEVEVTLKKTSLPSLTELNPENLYLEWQVDLVGETTREDIIAVFEWVEDDAEITVELLHNSENDIDGSGNATESTPSVGDWHIHFVPHESILKVGNDVYKMLYILSKMSDTYAATVQYNRLPSLKQLDPESCFLAWDIVISGNLSESDIAAVFEWVADESVVHIEKIDRQRIAQDKGEALTTTDEPVVAPVDSVLGKNKKVVKKPAAQEASSIRVGIDKVDSLINMVGELVITQSMLGQLGADFDVTKVSKLLEGLSQLEQNTRELQESVMRIRMLPISFAFSRFPRMVRDVGQQVNKSIQLEMLGEQTELDKTVMEKIGDPLVHLVRNAIDHGIEAPADRLAVGKPEFGLIVLNAYHQGGNVVIEISDDGKGLDRDAIVKKAIEKQLITESDAAILTDEQVYDLIFQPGFSTAQSVSDLSGRGVGMDVVRRNIQSLNGVVEVTSKKGEGSMIRIRLPLTLAILDGQLVRVGTNTYIFPLVSIVESIQCKKEHVSNIASGCSVFKLRDDYVPILRLNEAFSVNADYDELEKALLVVVESDGEKVGIVVDELLAQQQVVIKSLEQNYQRIEGVSGATILGDGTVALIIDIPGVLNLVGGGASAESSRHTVFMGVNKNSAETSALQNY